MTQTTTLIVNFERSEQKVTLALGRGKGNEGRVCFILRGPYPVPDDLGGERAK